MTVTVLQALIIQPLSGLMAIAIWACLGGYKDEIASLFLVTFLASALSANFYLFIAWSWGV